MGGLDTVNLRYFYSILFFTTDADPLKQRFWEMSKMPNAVNCSNFFIINFSLLIHLTLPKWIVETRQKKREKHHKSRNEWIDDHDVDISRVYWLFSIFRFTIRTKKWKHLWSPVDWREIDLKLRLEWHLLTQSRSSKQSNICEPRNRFSIVSWTKEKERKKIYVNRTTGIVVSRKIWLTVKPIENVMRSYRRPRSRYWDNSTSKREWRFVFGEQIHSLSLLLISLDQCSLLACSFERLLLHDSAAVTTNHTCWI